MDGKTRKVLMHATHVKMSDVTFKVSEAGRQRVLKEKQKNVHAYAIGQLEAVDGLDRQGQRYGFNENLLWSDYDGTEMYKQGFREVRYNPYKAPWFSGMYPEPELRHMHCVMRTAPLVMAFGGRMYASAHWRKTC